MRRLLALLALTLILPATASAAAPKLSSRLRDAVAGRSTLTPATGPGSLVRYGKAYSVDIRSADAGPALADRLRDAGAHVLAVSGRYDTVVATVAPNDLAKVAAVDGVQAVTENLAGETGGPGVAAEPQKRSANCRTGVVTEGDAQLRAAIARSTYNVDGTGIKVGVLSDSYNRLGGAANDVASGDLPGVGNPCGDTTPVDVKQEMSGGSPEDEGRAMLQIVHDIAPGAQLLFATAAGGSELQYANNIKLLRDSGANIIVDDYDYFAEPFFQDGPVANAINDVTASGVAYFSMAFNNAQTIGGQDVGSWEASAYRPTACPATVSAPAGADCMNFNPGAGSPDPIYTVGTTNGYLNVDLQWAQPRGAVTNNFDLCFLNPDDSLIGCTSGDNPTSQVPDEYGGISMGSGNRGIVIVRKVGSATPRIKFIIHNNGPQLTSVEYPTGGGVDTVGPTIYGHNATAGAQTVGAILYNSTTAPEPYSGRGPVTHYFAPVPSTTALAAPDVLAAPNVTATDGGINTFFGSGDRFTGTSAAAPHAAAVAALQLQATSGLSQADVKAEQRASAKPIGAFGPNAIGSGLVDAVGAIAAAPLLGTVTGPPAATNNRQPPTTFSARRTATFTCTLDGASAACTSPFVPAALSDGPHTLTVTATDNSGKAETSAPATFTVDATGPTAVISAGPTGLVNTRSPAFTFTAGEAGATTQCSFGGAFVPCISPAAPPAPLADGPHTFTVRGVDPLGNAGPPAPRAFTVDATAPVVSFKKKPKKKGTSRKAKFALKTSESATLLCKLDKGKFKACKTGQTRKVKPGKHTLSVRGTDAAGNVSKTVTYKWTVKKKTTKHAKRRSKR